MRDYDSLVDTFGPPVLVSIAIFVISLLTVLFVSPTMRIGELLVVLNLANAFYWFVVNIAKRLKMKLR